MMKLKIYLIFLFLLHINITVDAQKKTKIFLEPEMTKYLADGYAQNKKIYLMTLPAYGELNLEQKRKLLGNVTTNFLGHGVIVYMNRDETELWMVEENDIVYLDRWNCDSLVLDEFLPMNIDRTGIAKVFYYVGGMFNGGDGYSNGSLNFRLGSYLYKNIVDASATLNLGYTKTGNSTFAGDVGIDSRVYLPLKIKNVNLAPYAGTGFSYSFSPESYFEFRLLTGGCWFLGPGSLDIGLQYGTKSKFSLTVGYTFLISVKKKE